MEDYTMSNEKKEMGVTKPGCLASAAERLASLDEDCIQHAPFEFVSSQKLDEVVMKIIVFITAVLLCLSLGNVRMVRAEEPQIPLDPQVSGRVEGTAVHFELTNSSYLNIVLDSSSPIKILLESIPEMVTIRVESSSVATSSELTLCGFAPNTTYYKYEDNYHNLTPFTTDAGGRYTYTQDLSKPHLIFIQPRKSTKFIKDNSTGGDCWMIGTWDATAKTCTLIMDVNETIQIDNDNIILDGNGHNLIGSSTGSGVYLPQRTGVTIMNLNVINFYNGIYLENSNYNNLTNNNLTANAVVGIWLYSSSNNTLARNTVSSHPYVGIQIHWYSSNNIITDNTANLNNVGFLLHSNPSNNNLTGNTASLNSVGFHLYNGTSNTILTGNTSIDNVYGITMRFCTNTNNKIYNNNFINNQIGTWITYSSGNVFNLAAPIGGNYWSNYDSPAEGCNDLNSDNFCDIPYVFAGGKDNLPWIWQNGWMDHTPPTTADNSPLTWQKTDFTVLLACTDNPGGTGCRETRHRIDGGAWQVGNSLNIGTEGDHLVEYYSDDNIGNQEGIKSTHARLDKTPPAISGSPTTAPNANCWYKSDIVIHFTADDALSGIDTVTPDITITSEGNNQSVIGTATDKAGNSTSFTVSGINIDKTPPQVTIITPRYVNSYLLNENALANWFADDGLSGIASVTGTVPVGSAIDTGTAGIKSFSVIAADKAGNQITKTVTYYVVYVYGGILQPVNGDGSSLFKLGRTVPVKFILRDANGYFVATAIAQIYLAKISDGIIGSEIEPDSTSVATIGNLFRYDYTDNQYIFNLGTKTLSTGTWQLRILLNDGTSRYATISLK